MDDMSEYAACYPSRMLDNTSDLRPTKKVKLIASIPQHSPLRTARSKLLKSTEGEFEWDLQTNQPGSAAATRDDVPPRLIAKTRWADMMFVVAPSGFIRKMLAGDTESDIQAMIRSWDVTKPIVMAPQMSVDEWRNPATKRQLQKVRNKMPWVTITEPILWRLPEANKQDPMWKDVLWDWQGEDAAIEIMKQAADACMDADYGKKVHPLGKGFGKLPTPTRDVRNMLPPEILTMVFDFIGDWELAQTVGIYTNLPTPSEWLPHLPSAAKPGTLEYVILTSQLQAIRTAFSSTKPKSLSDLATKLIFKFSMIQVLTYLSVEQKDIFWTSFGLTLLPHRASVQFNKPDILQWWRKSPAIIKKDYGPEAVDGASRMGFVPVLDWWLDSSLPLLYTERALESASSKGHVEVLEWWKRAVDIRSKSDYPIKLKVGKSILSAAQSGRAEALEWWDKSGIPYGHEEGVARLASAHGHVNALRKWSELKGGKMVFDNQVLVGATKNGHADVLEWWKQSGMRVEYKTCDIEEAMEDSAVGGDREDQVRQWWERNGLNLGVGTNEWMKVKCLQVD